MATNQYSFVEACAILGVSAHTLRKRIRAGAVQAERVDRPQGYEWRVTLERAEDAVDVTAAGSDVTSDVQAATRHSQTAAAGSRPPDGAQLALALAPLVEASVNAAVAPLRAELADVRAVLSQRDQEVGQLRAVLAHVLADKNAAPAPEAKRTRWWAVWRWAAST